MKVFCNKVAVFGQICCSAVGWPFLILPTSCGFANLLLSHGVQYFKPTEKAWFLVREMSQFFSFGTYSRIISFALLYFFKPVDWRVPGEYILNFINISINYNKAFQFWLQSCAAIGWNIGTYEKVGIFVAPAFQLTAIQQYKLECKEEVLCLELRFSPQKSNTGCCCFNSIIVNVVCFSPVHDAPFS